MTIQAEMTWLNTWSQYITQAPFGVGLSVQAQQLIEAVLEATTQGNSCIEVSEQHVQSLQHLQAAPFQVAPFIFDRGYLYLYRYWFLEQQLAQHILRLQQYRVRQVDVAPYQDLLQDAHQQHALSIVANQGLTLITGGPGTGKTYTLARIIIMLSQSFSDLRIAMAAPTGKAAQRMKEALQNSFNDPKLTTMVTDDLKHLTPITLHRLLGLGTQQKAQFNVQQPLPFDVIVIDEASMLDLNLAHMLFAAVASGTRLILLGDANQLASVDVGAVLADLQKMDQLAAHRVNLMTSRRFKAGAHIGQLAQFIQQDHQPTQVLTDLEQLIPAATIQPISLKVNMQDIVQLEYLPDQLTKMEYAGYYDKLMLGFESYIAALKDYIQSDQPDVIDVVLKQFDHYRILTAIRHGALGLQQINQQIEQRLLAALALYTVKQGDWYIGRPVMMVYNDYQLGLSNGDIGVCFQRYYDGQQQFEVYFPSLEKWLPATRLPKSMETAFALTIHKSQGSEFTHTAVVLDQYAQNLLSKELIYTAITRAKSVITLLAHPQSLIQALTIKSMRFSGLLDQLNKLR